jgi:hypothetical protein
MYFVILCFVVGAPAPSGLGRWYAGAVRVVSVVKLAVLEVSWLLFGFADLMEIRLPGGWVTHPDSFMMSSSLRYLIQFQGLALNLMDLGAGRHR